MKISWLGLIIMAVLCIAMDVYICRRLRRNGYRWPMWFNILLAVLAAALVIAIGVLPMSSASMPNSTFVNCQYMLYTFFAILAPKAIGMVVYGLLRWMKRRWAAFCAFIVAALIFGVMWWGAIVTPGTIEALRKAGFTYGRTTQYAADVLADNPEPLALKSSCHFLSRDFWTRYDAAKARGGVFYFWGHSYEMFQYDALWNRMDETLRYIADDPDAEWIDVVDLARRLPAATARP